ncbi:hypothetical protein SASPL_102885 [Salvia splendens]|uniref:Protein kinase domain-containing protein n=1 Tax=Salvia splendens TaxID=180675 RepID=A0A8X9AED6_SALSN|nr:hypothetical protein SASPL_102885 [Salvia splendens]
MSCFPCFSCQRRASKRSNEKRNGAFPPSNPHQDPSPQPRPNYPCNENPRKTAEATTNKATNKEGGDNNNIAAQTFTFRELTAATKNFRQEYMLGEGRFGRVYKGCLHKTYQLVAVKQLDRNGLQGNREFLVEDYNAKLSDFGLAKLGPVGDKCHVSTRVMGTYGYCALEYQRTGQLTVKSDVHSFGVVLLELITGKRAVDNKRSPDQQNLVTWAEPIFMEPSKFSELADPMLRGDFPKKSFNQAVVISAMCLQKDTTVRPLISDVVTALSCLPLQGDAGCSRPISSPSPA